MARSCLTLPDLRRVPVTVYALCEPDTGEVRYVGRTQDLSTRLRVHRYQGARAVRSWIRALGRSPVVRVLCEVKPGEDSAAAELKALTAVRETATRLLNKHLGAA